MENTAAVKVPFGGTTDKKSTERKHRLNDFRIKNTTHFGIQRKMVSYMTTHSWQNVPHVTYVYEPDVTDFFEEFKRLNDSGLHSRKITFNTLMLKVFVEGIKADPAVNAHIDYNHKYVKGELKTIEDINISMPWILPNGEMMTINLRNFESKSLDQMAEYIENIAQKIENTDLNEAMYEVSHRFFKKTAEMFGVDLGGVRDYGVGMFFFPQNPLKRRQAQKMFEVICSKEGVKFLFWRDVPVNADILGQRAKDTMPYICQCFVARPDNLKKGHVIQTMRKLAGAKFGRYKVKTLSGEEKKEYESIPESERITKYDLEPGTITISNIGSVYKEQRGMIGILEIIPPQVFAIGVGGVQDKPGIFKNHKGKQEIGVRKMLPICLAFDHRALDFGEVVPFMKRLDDIFANPAQIHNW